MKYAWSLNVYSVTQAAAPLKPPLLPPLAAQDGIKWPILPSHVPSTNCTQFVHSVSFYNISRLNMIEQERQPQVHMI